MFHIHVVHVFQVARRLARSFLANMGAQGLNMNQQVPPGGAAKKKQIAPKKQEAPFSNFKVNFHFVIFFVKILKFIDIVFMNIHPLLINK